MKADISSELSGWIDKFLEDAGVDYDVSLGDFENVIEDYMNRGFRYYVLDLITVSTEEQSVDPILYKFNSDFLYYPLVITSPLSGDTEIVLFTLTDEKIDEGYSPFQKLTYTGISSGWNPIELVLSTGDLSKIDLRIGEMFQHKAWLTVLKYEGKISGLNRDLMVSVTPTSEPTINIEVTLPATTIILFTLLTAASTLAGVISTLLITKFRFKRSKQS